MQPVLKPFASLTVNELYSIYKLRSEVFVVEQNCAYQDPDEKDPLAFHLMILEQGDLIAYARILPPGVSYTEPSIGRVLVTTAERSKGTGKYLMLQSILETRLLFGKEEIVISAQTYLLRFYTALGFIAEGTEYSEDNIPHIRMRYPVKI